MKELQLISKKPLDYSIFTPYTRLHDNNIELNKRRYKMKTPCEKLGYKVGDQFEVTEGSTGFTIGQIVELNKDDGSDAPLFKGENYRFQIADNRNSGGAYLYLEFVKPCAQLPVNHQEEHKETFKCSFKHYDKKKTKGEASGDPLFTNEVIECFLEAYNNSGYCNELTIIMHGAYGGDQVFTSNVNQDGKQKECNKKLDLEVSRKLESIQSKIEAMQEEIKFIKSKYEVN